jgi:hypothetical protein
MQAILGRIELLGHLVRTEGGSSNVLGLNSSQTTHLLLFLSFSVHIHIYTLWPCLDPKIFEKKFL